MKHRREQDHSRRHEDAAPATDVQGGEYDLVPNDCQVRAGSGAGSGQVRDTHDWQVRDGRFGRQVRDTHDSACPVCGMALEPERIGGGEEDTSEVDTTKRRFWFSAMLTLPLFLYAMGDVIPGRPFSDSSHRSKLIASIR